MSDSAILDKEQALLGSLIVRNNRKQLFYAIAGKLLSHHFVHYKHRKIYGVICQLYATDKVIDLITVKEACGDGIDAIDLVDLSECAMGMDVRAANQYADDIHEAYQVREAQLLATTLHAVTDVDDVQDVHDKLANVLIEVCGGDFSVLAEDCHDVIQHILDVADGKKAPGIELGFTELDKKIMGVPLGSQMIIGASTSVGKTTLGFNVAWNVVQRGHKVAFFSAEQSKPEIYMKAFSALLGIPVWRLRIGKLDDSERSKMRTLPGLLTDKGLICDFDSMELDALIYKIRRAVNEHEIVAVFIDYLQLVSSKDGETREQQVASVSRRLKAIAKEMKIIVVGLSQINRAWASRKEHRPELYDLRESGSIEQDTDYALLIWRTMEESILHCDLAKNRITGHTGEFDLRYIEETGQYADHWEPR